MIYSMNKVVDVAKKVPEDKLSKMVDVANKIRKMPKDLCDKKLSSITSSGSGITMRQRYDKSN